MEGTLQSGSASQWSFKKAIAPGLEGVEQYWPSLLFIQAVALAIVIVYYQSFAIRSSFAGIASAKVRYGLPFAFAIGFAAGGVIPEIAKLLTGKVNRANSAWIAHSSFNGFVYGVIGILVDIFYRLQADLFGATPNLTVVLLKTTVDMLVFSPLLSIPLATFLLAWRRHKFKSGLVFQAGFSNFYKQEVLAGLIPCWAFWTPVLLCTYSLPVNLQLVFAMLAEAAWSIVFVFINSQSTSAP